MPTPDAPILGGCGGVGQPDCPPQPAATIHDVSKLRYTHEDMLAHGRAQYRKGWVDSKSSVKGDL